MFVFRLVNGGGKNGRTHSLQLYLYIHISSAYTLYYNIIYSISLILSLIMSNLCAQTTYPYEYFKSPFSIFRSSNRRIQHACDEQIIIKHTMDMWWIERKKTLEGNVFTLIQQPNVNKKKTNVITDSCDRI